MNTMEVVRNRRSVRSFAHVPLAETELKEILRSAETAETPYGLPIEWRILDAKTQGLSSPVISGTDCYIAGKMRRAPHAEEAFGYAFERVVLSAASRGIGTTWIGGTMDRAAFERAMQLEEGEIMPCVSPLGYPAEKMSLRESMMRKAIKADSRLPFETLFYDGSPDRPLTAEKAGKLAAALEMVRWAPSAVNRQPWRVIVTGDALHFYEKQGKGFVSADGWDMQKIDIGIALCHFAAGMEDAGIRTEFVLDDPGLSQGSGLVYMASFQLC
ncbi:MAG: nitroreductase family protein [Oscillospiraceae bacterium]|nr:nitroreductase family protein [Oscillospiraceae bacterium]